MISLDQMAVLTGAQLRMVEEPPPGPDHVAVIGHRLAVKLNQTIRCTGADEGSRPHHSVLPSHPGMSWAEAGADVNSKGLFPAGSSRRLCNVSQIPSAICSGGPPGGLPQDPADIRHQICQPLRVLRPFSIAAASLASAQGHTFPQCSFRSGLVSLLPMVAGTGRASVSRRQRGRCRVVNIKKFQFCVHSPSFMLPPPRKGAQAGLNQRPWVIPGPLPLYILVEYTPYSSVCKVFSLFRPKSTFALPYSDTGWQGRVLCHSLVPDSVLRLGSGK